MLKNRIISTIRFFDLQDYPLTLLELQRFLIVEVENLKLLIDGQGEVVSGDHKAETEILADKILASLDLELQNQVQNTLGFYHLPNRKQIVQNRLDNYFFGIQREKLIKRYIRGLKYIPFVRGAALAGSQAMGQQKENSDIDLLIISHPKYMWLARTLVTAYFQVLGLRRHGKKVANRFCLNHYLAGPKKIKSLRNLYTASEYLKLRPLVSGSAISNFQFENADWVKIFFPNAHFKNAQAVNATATQVVLEKILSGAPGQWLERLLKSWQMPKIRREKFIVVEEDELSFHPDSKQKVLLEKFLFE